MASSPDAHMMDSEESLSPTTKKKQRKTAWQKLKRAQVRVAKAKADAEAKAVPKAAPKEEAKPKATKAKPRGKPKAKPKVEEEPPTEQPLREEGMSQPLV